MKFDAEVKVNLEGIKPRFDNSFKRAQIYLDSAVLNESRPYTPLLTGKLMSSSIENTNVGGGSVVWRTKYARKVYYVPAKRGIGSDTGPLRGYRWFDRMMADKGKLIIEQTKKIAGG